MDVRIKYEGRPKASNNIQPQKRRPVEVQILPEEHTEVSGSRIEEFAARAQDLRDDLAALKDQERMEGISSELIQAREKELQKQLLETVMERERLVRKVKGQK